MWLELDHLFICVQRDAPEAERLAWFGLLEGRRRKHKGQGTANVCFFFRNAMLELIWVCDEEEVRSPLVRPTRLWERWRWRETACCPFGVCFRPAGESRQPLPFSTWAYKPPYIPEGMSIPIATNSERCHEPLIFVSTPGRRPDRFPEGQRPPLEHAVGYQEITDVRVVLPLRDSLSPELRKIQELGLISVLAGDEYRMEICFDEGKARQEAPFVPELPLTFRW